jgi:hypothetical protein
MRQLFQDRLAVLRGWPRRAAAVLCLLLAAATAVGSRASGESPRRPEPLTADLGAGEVLVPVTLAGSADFVHAGDRVDLLAAAPDAGTASTLGTGLLVVRVGKPPPEAFASEGGGRLLVAAERTVAANIAAAPTGQVVAVLDKYP